MDQAYHKDRYLVGKSVIPLLVALFFISIILIVAVL